MSDLIRRQDAIEAIKMVLDDGGEWFVEAVNDIPSAGQNCILCEYYTEIETDDGIKGKCIRRTVPDKALPSAEPKTGKWLFDKDGYFRCEVCGKKPNDQNTTTDYCPHCGARLGGDTE